MKYVKKWQCGHCGSVYRGRTQAEECCGGFQELSYQCNKCKALFNKKPKGKCFCGAYPSLKEEAPE